MAVGGYSSIKRAVFPLQSKTSKTFDLLDRLNSNANPNHFSRHRYWSLLGNANE
jgi:hypothetical protein